MSEPRISYQRLGRWSVRSDTWLAWTTTRVRLFLGPDHLLLVEKAAYKESYRRFYYKDIQAFLMEKTKRWMYWNVGLVLAAVIFLAFGLAASRAGPAGFFYVVAGTLGFCLLINWFKGQSCRCYLQTAVQCEELPSFNREREVKKALALLRARIMAVQGQSIAAQPAAPEIPPDTEESTNIQ